MSSRSRWLIVLISSPLVAFITVGGLLGAARTPAAQSGFEYLGVFQEVLNLITHAYVEQPNIDKVMEGAMHGLAEGLDPSSAYLTAEEVRAIEAKAPLPSGDVGLVVTRQFYLRIVGVRDGSPAAKAGLQTGDFIRMIDQRPTRDMSAITGARLLRGQPGSKLTLTVIRGNAADPHIIDLVRVPASGDDATVTPLAGGIARIRVASFGPGTAATLRKLFDGLAAQKLSAAVIDLRGTADGTADDGIAAARLFVKSGTLAIRASRAPEQVKVTASPGDGAITTPVALLVSNGTANAAEIFAAALSGNSRAELVGEPTAGIAASQKLVRLPQNTGLWLTTERYLTVDGVGPIHERGLRPTVGVAIPTIGFDELPPTTDEPLNRAAERLRKK